MEPVMPGRITTEELQIDPPTSRAVARGIGEKLQQTLATEQRFPDRLQKLLDRMRELESREAPTRGDGGNRGRSRS
jgi:hypothetical protein